MLIIGKNQNKYELLSGTLYVYKNKSNKDRFFLKTKTSSLGVRGTKFFVKEEKEHTYLCVCSGEVLAGNSKGKISVTAGEDTHIRKDEKPQKLKATQNMMTLALKGFDLMGEPVN